MTTANAPYPNYNGIPYNRAFFTSATTTGITQAQSDARYLQKTTADTATSLETFNGGITIGNNSNINLPTTVTAPTLTSQQGCIMSVKSTTQPTGGWLSNYPNPVFNNLTLPAGNWIVSYNFRLGANFYFNTASATVIECYIYNTADPYNNTSNFLSVTRYATSFIQNAVIGIPILSGSCFLSLTAASTSFNVGVIVGTNSLPKGNLVTFSIGTGNEVASFSAMRIA